MDRSQVRMTLKAQGVAATKPRVLLLEILDGINAPISVQQLYQNHSEKFALSTLYRVVNDLATANILETFTSPDQNIWIEIKSEDGHHHHLRINSNTPASLSLFDPAVQYYCLMFFVEFISISNFVFTV